MNNKYQLLFGKSIKSIDDLAGKKHNGYVHSSVEYFISSKYDAYIEFVQPFNSEKGHVCITAGSKSEAYEVSFSDNGIRLNTYGPNPQETKYDNLDVAIAVLLKPYNNENYCCFDITISEPHSDGDDSPYINHLYYIKADKLKDYIEKYDGR